MTERIILQGVVGSTAYGLAREGSDLDQLGVFVARTRDILSLNPPAESVVQTKPDITLHEVGKYIRLALKCNPTILELLWLEDYFVQDYLGNLLREKRHIFLSDKCVRAAYGGYALQQALKLKARGQDKRTPKHARHCFRLLRQGRQLLEAGQLSIKVDDPEFYWQFDKASVDEIVALFQAEDALFQAAESCLPDKPDYTTADEILLTIRGDNW